MGVGGSGSSQGSVNTYLLNNIYYYPGKKRHCLPARLLNFNIYFNIKHVEK